MKKFEWLQNAMQYVWNGVKRIFSPSDDDYPETGVQPFKDEPFDEQRQSSL